MLECRVDWPFVILSGYVMLASGFIACNLKCNPWRKNKVLVTLLFLIDGFISATCSNVM
jgi:hypothetical protein